MVDLYPHLEPHHSHLCNCFTAGVMKGLENTPRFGFQPLISFTPTFSLWCRSPAGSRGLSSHVFVSLSPCVLLLLSVRCVSVSVCSCSLSHL